MVLLLEQQKFTTVEANTPEKFYQVRQKAWVVHWGVEVDVAEVSGANLHRRLASETLHLLVHDTHARVINCVEIRLECLLIIDQCR